jgi:hypothetical protein
MLRTLFFIFLIFCIQQVFGQADPLPQFSVTKKNNKITISWKNNYTNTTQINIQRSKDSNRNYITIHSCLQPLAKSYSFTDPSATNDTMYYRIFMLFDGATYSFTKPKRPVEEKQTIEQAIKNEPKTIDKKETITIPPKKDTVSKKENQIVNKPVIAVKDSSKQNKDQTITEIKKIEKKEVLPDSIHLQYAQLERHPRKEKRFPVSRFQISLPEKFNNVWQPSVFVYTGDDGNVVIDLPESTKYKYSIIFAREEGRPLFSLPEIKENRLVLDKVAFLKSGWYYFELRENGKVKERNKFLITRDY